MSLVVLKEVSIGYRGPLLLDAVDCRIDAKQRIGLLGRNGAGKTTLMRLMVGDEAPDSGAVVVDAMTRVALLPQDVPDDVTGPITEIIGQGLDAEDTPAWQVDQQVAQIAILPGPINLYGASKFGCPFFMIANNYADHLYNPNQRSGSL